jgi:hypothetical protein
LAILIVFGEEYKLLSSSSCLLLFHPSWVHIFSSASCSKNPSVCSSLNVRDKVPRPYKTTVHRPQFSELYFLLNFLHFLECIGLSRGCKKLHNEKLHNMYVSSNITYG